MTYYFVISTEVSETNGSGEISSAFPWVEISRLHYVPHYVKARWLLCEASLCYKWSWSLRAGKPLVDMTKWVIDMTSQLSSWGERSGLEGSHVAKHHSVTSGWDVSVSNTTCFLVDMTSYLSFRPKHAMHAKRRNPICFLIGRDVSTPLDMTLLNNLVILSVTKDPMWRSTTV